MSETVKGKPGRKSLSPEGEKRVTVSTSLDAATFAALEDIRWTNRINTLGEVVRKAVEAYVEASKTESPVTPA